MMTNYKQTTETIERILNNYEFDLIEFIPFIGKFIYAYRMEKELKQNMPQYSEEKQLINDILRQEILFNKAHLNFKTYQDVATAAVYLLSSMSVAAYVLFRE